MEQQIPKPIAYYLEAEAVTEGHVRQATELLRNVYAEEPLSEPLAREICEEGSAFLDSPEAALEVLSEARPEEVPTLDVYNMPLPSAVVVEGCRVFADYVFSNITGRCLSG